MNEIERNTDGHGDSAISENPGAFKIEYSEGPLPAPVVLRDYDRYVPGAAERIINQWEVASEHRRKMESDGLKHVRTIQIMSQLVRLVIAFLSIGLGGLLVPEQLPAGMVAIVAGAISYPLTALLNRLWARRDVVSDNGE